MKKLVLLLLICSIAASCAVNASAKTKGARKMMISSLAFKNMENIPVKYTYDGERKNPPFKIENVPANVKSLALTCVDTDAPSGEFVHWVVFNIPPSIKEIKEGSSPAGAVKGSNTIGKLEYIPPTPPPGKIHHYIFTLYAINEVLALKQGASRLDVEEAMQGHLIVKATLTGLYKR
jgi:Raf kinase inhibitor-like YbhB/YbcL family protein